MAVVVQTGTCRFGDRCKFSHDLKSRSASQPCAENGSVRANRPELLDEEKEGEDKDGSKQLGNSHDLHSRDVGCSADEEKNSMRTASV
jgi:CCCH-type zinc finger